MRTSSSILIAGLSTLSTVSAWANTSPFFLISTSELPTSSQPPQNVHSSVQSTTYFKRLAKDVISQCGADAYMIVHQPELHANDFQYGGEEVMTYIGGVLSEGRKEGKGIVVVPYVRAATGEVEGGKEMADELKEWAETKCGAEGMDVDVGSKLSEHFGDMKPKVIRIDFPAIAEEEGRKGRSEALRDTDAFLHSVLLLLETRKYTLIYTSTARPVPVSPPNAKTKTNPHTTLRLLNQALHKRGGNETAPPPSVEGSLFQRYAFFSPGILMGYLAAFFLFGIAWVALSGLTSLKVSYAAFEKEMGPGAARKAQ